MTTPAMNFVATCANANIPITCNKSSQSKHLKESGIILPSGASPADVKERFAMLAWTRHAISSSFLHSPTSLRNKPATPQRMMPASTPPRSCSCCPPCAAPRELLTGRPRGQQPAPPPALAQRTSASPVPLDYPDRCPPRCPVWPRLLPTRLASTTSSAPLWPTALRP